MSSEVHRLYTSAEVLPNVSPVIGFVEIDNSINNNYQNLFKTIEKQLETTLKQALASSESYFSPSKGSRWGTNNNNNSSDNISTGGIYSLASYDLKQISMNISACSLSSLLSASSLASVFIHSRPNEISINPAPIVIILLVCCNEIKQYKSIVKNRIQQFSDCMLAFEYTSWMVLFVPSTIAPFFPPHVSENNSSLQSLPTSLPKIEKKCYTAIRADFGKEKVNFLECTSDKDSIRKQHKKKKSKGEVKEQSSIFASVSVFLPSTSFVSAFRNLFLSTLEANLSTFETAIKNLSSNTMLVSSTTIPTLPSTSSITSSISPSSSARTRFDFPRYFALKDSIAVFFRQLGLLELSLAQYEELHDLCLVQYDTEIQNNDQNGVREQRMLDSIFVLVHPSQDSTTSSSFVFPYSYLKYIYLCRFQLLLSLGHYCKALNSSLEFIERTADSITVLNPNISNMIVAGWLFHSFLATVLVTDIQYRMTQNEEEERNDDIDKSSSESRYFFLQSQLCIYSMWRLDKLSTSILGATLFEPKEEEKEAAKRKENTRVLFQYLPRLESPSLAFYSLHQTPSSASLVPFPYIPSLSSHAALSSLWMQIAQSALYFLDRTHPRCFRIAAWVRHQLSSLRQIIATTTTHSPDSSVDMPTIEGKLALSSMSGSSAFLLNLRLYSSFWHHSEEEQRDHNIYYNDVEDDLVSSSSVLFSSSGLRIAQQYGWPSLALLSRIRLVQQLLETDHLVEAIEHGLPLFMVDENREKGEVNRHLLFSSMSLSSSLSADVAKISSQLISSFLPLPSSSHSGEEIPDTTSVYFPSSSLPLTSIMEIKSIRIDLLYPTHPVYACEELKLSLSCNSLLSIPLSISELVLILEVFPASQAKNETAKKRVKMEVCIHNATLLDHPSRSDLSGFRFSFSSSSFPHSLHVSKTNDDEATTETQQQRASLIGPLIVALSGIRATVRPTAIRGEDKSAGILFEEKGLCLTPQSTSSPSFFFSFPIHPLSSSLKVQLDVMPESRGNVDIVPVEYSSTLLDYSYDTHQCATIDVNGKKEDEKGKGGTFLRMSSPLLISTDRLPVIGDANDINRSTFKLTARCHLLAPSDATTETHVMFDTHTLCPPFTPVTNITSSASDTCEELIVGPLTSFSVLHCSLPLLFIISATSLYTAPKYNLELIFRSSSDGSVSNLIFPITFIAPLQLTAHHVNIDKSYSLLQIICQASPSFNISILSNSLSFCSPEHTSCDLSSTVDAHAMTEDNNPKFIDSIPLSSVLLQPIPDPLQISPCSSFSFLYRLASSVTKDKRCVDATFSVSYSFARYPEDQHSLSLPCSLSSSISQSSAHSTQLTPLYSPTNSSSSHQPSDSLYPLELLSPETRKQMFTSSCSIRIPLSPLLENQEEEGNFSTGLFLISSEISSTHAHLNERLTFSFSVSLTTTNHSRDERVVDFIRNTTHKQLFFELRHHEEEKKGKEWGSWLLEGRKKGSFVLDTSYQHCSQEEKEEKKHGSNTSLSKQYNTSIARFSCTLIPISCGVLSSPVVHLMQEQFDDDKNAIISSQKEEKEDQQKRISRRNCLVDIPHELITYHPTDILYCDISP